jgi:hypothetical protein
MAQSTSKFVELVYDNTSKMQDWFKAIKDTIPSVTDTDPDNPSGVTVTFTPNWGAYEPDSTCVLQEDCYYMDHNTQTALTNAQMLLLMMAEDLRKAEESQEFSTKNWRSLLDNALCSAMEDYHPSHSDLLPGASPVAAALMHARAVCHRAERVMTSIQSEVPDEWFEFIDRLANKLGGLANNQGLFDGYQVGKHELDTL